ncbi:MAG: Smr/MutS family protein [Crocinitomicaceae bacterium]
MLRTGDHIVVIADTIKGTVKKVENNTITIEDEFGFSRVYRSEELAKANQESDYKISDDVLDKEISEKIKQQLTEDQNTLKSFEIDLHIEELVESHAAMTNHEILTKQMIVCKNFVRKAMDKETPKIVIIHGKGEGVLKSEIHSFLHKLRDWDGVKLDYHDASFAEYGISGATEVIFY